MPNKIVFFGNERLSTGTDHTDAPTLRALISNQYDVVAVVAHHEIARSRKPRPLEVEEIAVEHGIPVLTPDKPAEIIDQLRAMKADAGVLVAYGRIIPQSIIDIFPHGIINLHPSLLPKYRGPIPIEQAILDGAAQTGVSIMQLGAEMDAGPVYAQEAVDLTGTETKPELTQKLLSLGATTLAKILPGVLNGSITPQSQDESKATYCQLLSKGDGEIDWDKPAAVLGREVRAFLGWPGSHTKLFDKDVIITAAHVENDSAAAGEISNSRKELKVFCGQDALIIDTLKPAGKNEMTGVAFLSGIK